jgi:hypothetical protein
MERRGVTISSTTSGGLTGYGSAFFPGQEGNEQGSLLGSLER